MYIKVNEEKRKIVLFEGKKLAISKTRTKVVPKNVSQVVNRSQDLKVF